MAGCPRGSCSECCRTWLYGIKARRRRRRAGHLASASRLRAHLARHGGLPLRSAHRPGGAPAAAVGRCRRRQRRADTPMGTSASSLRRSCSEVANGPTAVTRSHRPDARSSQRPSRRVKAGKRALTRRDGRVDGFVSGRWGRSGRVPGRLQAVRRRVGARTREKCRALSAQVSGQKQRSSRGQRNPGAKRSTCSESAFSRDWTDGTRDATDDTRDGVDDTRAAGFRRESSVWTRVSSTQSRVSSLRLREAATAPPAAGTEDTVGLNDTRHSRPGSGRTDSCGHLSGLRTPADPGSTSRMFPAQRQAGRHDLD